MKAPTQSLRKASLRSVLGRRYICYPQCTTLSRQNICWTAHWEAAAAKHTHVLWQGLREHASLRQPYKRGKQEFSIVQGGRQKYPFILLIRSGPRSLKTTKQAASAGERAKTGQRFSQSLAALGLQEASTTSTDEHLEGSFSYSLPFPGHLQEVAFQIIFCHFHVAYFSLFKSTLKERRPHNQHCQIALSSV